MKKLVDLLNERTEKIGKMEAILNKAQTENRKRTEAESTEWTSLDTEVRSLSEEIKILERQNALNLEIAGNNPPDKESRNAIKRFNLAKAIREAQKGALTGLEREMHDEGEKEIRHLDGVVGNLYIPSMLIGRSYKRANEETKTTGAAGGHIPTFTENADMGLVVASPLYRDLGCTVYENLTSGKLEIPFSQGNVAASVAEESAASQSVPTKSKGTLTAGRVQGWQKFTTNYLSESAVLPSLIADMISAVDRGVGNAAILDNVATNVMSGFATSDTAAAITWAGLLAQISAITSDQFQNEAFVMSKALFYFLASKEKATNTAKFIVDLMAGGNNLGMVGGVKAFGTSFLPLHDTNKYDAVYGDYKQMYIGFWGGVQLLIDPFTSSDNGYVKITFSRMAAWDSNPYAFAAKRNISLA